MMNSLKLVSVSLTLFLMTFYAQANSLIVNTGFQMEDFKLDTGQDDSRTSIGSFSVEYEFDIHKKLTIGIQGAAATNLATQETLSFGLGGYFNYFFKGQHNFSSFKRGDVSAIGTGSNWAYFAGGGVEQRFLNSSEISSENKGGIFIRGGARRIWNEKMFFQGYLKYLLGGDEYTSIDVFIGVGFRL